MLIYHIYIYFLVCAWWTGVWHQVMHKTGWCCLKSVTPARKPQQRSFRLNNKDTGYWDIECVFQLLPLPHAVSVAAMGWSQAHHFTEPSASTAPWFWLWWKCVCVLWCVAVSFVQKQTCLLESKRSCVETCMQLSRREKGTRSYCKPEVWRESKEETH